jgi:DNA (cytosine-5)-methyltransferase 1
MKTLGGLFSGIGGIESGFEKAGFKTLWSNENDPYSVRSFKHNFKHQLYDEDIRKIDFRQLKPVDVLVGGFPLPSLLSCWIPKRFLKTQEVIFFLIFAELLQNYLKCLKLLCLKTLKILEATMVAKLQE